MERLPLENSQALGELEEVGSVLSQVILSLYTADILSDESLNFM
jgi:hypothetical protein